VPEQPVPEQDPITSKSYAVHYAVATVVLIGSLFWALWDEAYGQRPWKRFQTEFKSRYSRFLHQARTQSADELKGIEDDSQYHALNVAFTDAQKKSDAEIKGINDQLRDISARILAVQNVFTDKRAYVGAETYSLETATSKSEKESIRKDLEKYKAGPFTVEYPDGTRKKFNYDDLEREYNGLKDQRTQLGARLAELLKPITEAKDKRDAYLSDHLVDLTPEQIRGLQHKIDDWDPTIVQINVAEANIVDRCESCHMGIREPLRLTASAMSLPGKKPDEYARAFVTHPEKRLLSIHDPDKFGCSPCHQGNGRATTSIEKAHGDYEHWLWPLFQPANAEAGCQTCHAADMWLRVGDVGATISEGKFLFRQRGCNGCHRYEGYDAEPEELLSIQQQIKQLEQQQRDNLKQAAYLMKQADDPKLTNEQANKLNEDAVGLKVANSKISGQIEQADLKSSSLLKDMKKIGPDLKEIRAKLNRNWIPVWLHKPTDFRPATKMPNFRLTDDQVKAITAYLWESALADPIPHGKPGNPSRGKDLFETRGCLGCHSIGEGSNLIGGDFAANLSRVGEKVNYDYLVRWISNPRQRLRPYCPYEKKDIGPADYAKHGLPYLVDFEHTTCPNDGHELQIEQMTVMPNLRLSEDEVADIATYLLQQRKQEPGSYPDAFFMEDPKLKEEGRRWIRHYGCAGCHEIAGFEEEGRIGTELTAEGSKPIERLDFALFTEPAMRGGKDPISGQRIGPWYDHKGFFEHKLAKPDIYDQGKIKSQTEALRMPDPHLTQEQIRDLTTFLLGSQETSLPASYLYRPQDARRDIQEGWWIVRKYNCVGCHQFVPGQKTALEGSPIYADAKEKLPPKLLTEGARVSPDWLMKFLSNPSLSATDTHRNGVRPYLQVRMPTFYFSENELRKLVRFFQALSQQPLPYVPQRQELLTASETEMARSLFASQAAPCLKCHATGDPAHDAHATAPNFLLARERLKPGWTERWIVDPQSISPGTAMPSNLFRKAGDQWVFSGPTPPSFNGYTKDHTKLLVRYIFQLTPEEQHRVGARMPAAPTKAEKAPSRAHSPQARARGAVPSSSPGGSR